MEALCIYARGWKRVKFLSTLSLAWSMPKGAYAFLYAGEYNLYL